MSDRITTPRRPRTITPPSAVLEVLTDDGEPSGTAFYVSNAGTTLGRSVAADVRLKGDSVSRKHARIEARGRLHVLIDLGSANGTAVNGAEVSDRVCDLNDGAVVRIEGVVFRYRRDDGGWVSAGRHAPATQLVRHDDERAARRARPARTAGPGRKPIGRAARTTKAP